MDFKKAEDSNIRSIMEPTTEAATPPSLEALDEAPTPEELETLLGDNPFFDIDTKPLYLFLNLNLNIPLGATKTLKFLNVGPREKPLIWYRHLQQVTFDNCVKGCSVIAADTILGKGNTT